MKSHLSLYINILRILASIGVFLSHVTMYWFSDWTYFDGMFGHYCVVIFFVLSGFLIAYTNDVGKKDLKGYAADRLSRLYCVAFPALLFTYIADAIGSTFNPEFYSTFLNPEYQPLKFLINLLFLQQTLFFHTNPSTNGVFWSLSYEFWYYVIFACFCFLRGKARILSVFVACLIAGLKILMLFPIWLLGVGVYKLSKRTVISEKYALPCFLITTLFAAYLFVFTPTFFSSFGRLGFPTFYYSSNVFNDAFYGLIVAVNLFSLTQIKGDYFSVSTKINSILKYTSLATFPLYAFHFPLMLLLRSFYAYDKSNMFIVSMLSLFIVGFVLTVTYFLENTRKKYQDFFLNILNRLHKGLLSFSKV